MKKALFCYLLAVLFLSSLSALVVFALGSVDLDGFVAAVLDGFVGAIVEILQKIPPFVTVAVAFGIFIAFALYQFDFVSFRSKWEDYRDKKYHEKVDRKCGGVK